MENYKRFLIPTIFSIFGIMITIFVTLYLATGIVGVVDTYDLIPRITGGIQTDILSLLILFLPIYIVVYVLLTLPLALLMIVFNKISRTRTYEIGIFSTGKDFNSSKMIRRAIVPSLFALSSAEIFLNLLPDWVFRIPDLTATPAAVIYRNLDPIQTILGALLAMVVGIMIFVPTWTLNDSGIVTQVKAHYMESRRCPDTEGIGRWFSNLFGGFAILTYPITTFFRYFYVRFFVHGVELNLANFLISVFWIIGIPLLIMSFILPFIILHEFGLGWITPRVQGFARKFGAKDVKQKSLMLEMLEIKDQLNESSDDEINPDSTRLTRM